MKPRICFPLSMSVFTTVMALSLSAMATPTEEDKQQADKHFKIAMALVKAKKHKEACPLFAESFRLDPVINAELQLAICYTHIEKPASAYKHFLAGSDKCAIVGDDARRIWAEEQANAIKADVPKLEFQVVENGANLAGFVVKVDGQAIDGKHFRGSSPEPVLLDPGEHRVEWATAEGNEGSEALELAIAGRRLVTIELRRAPPDPAQIKRRKAALIVGAVGVGGFVTAGIASAFVVKNRDIAYGFCHENNPDYCTPRAQELGAPFLQAAYTQAHLATAMVTIGGVAAATAITLYAWPAKRSKEKTPRAFVVPSLDKTNAGLTVIGSF